MYFLFHSSLVPDMWEYLFTCEDNENVSFYLNLFCVNVFYYVIILVHLEVYNVAK
jgi:hypothetical protein